MSSVGTHELILDQEHLRRHLGLAQDYAREAAKLRADTPDRLKTLVHYAIAWGIDDDGYRREFILGASEFAKKNLKWVIASREDDLDYWLAGPEANANNFTTAYIAFSNMRMASDEIID